MSRFFGAPDKLKDKLYAKFGAFVHSVTILTKFGTNSLDYYKFESLKGFKGPLYFNSHYRTQKSIKI